MIVYVDVLFILNFFITLLLLMLTSSITKRKPKTIRLIFASFLGGAYSLIIFANINSVLLFLSKMIALILIMLVAYKFTTAKSFTRCTAIFIFCNFIFLGVIIGFCMIFKSNYICVKNSVVYFDVSAIQLLGCSLVAYLVSTVIIRLHNKSLSKDEIYTLVIENNASAVTLFAFVDTGNRLTEPFSNAPVIIVDRKKVEPIADVSTLRIIPTKTVNCNSLLKAFKPDKVTIKSSNHQEVLDNVYIALSDEINDDNFSAILNPNILNV